MSRWVDLPVRVVGDTSADVDPDVVAMVTWGPGR